MLAQEIENIFKSSGALLKGHFILSSGNHSDTYLQCALLTQHPDVASCLASALVVKLASQEVDIVIGPAIGGIVIAQEMAQALSRIGKSKVRAIFCERAEGKMVLRRGFSVQPEEKVLAVEDVVTTGGSIKEAIVLTKALAGKVVGAAAFVDRSLKPLDLGAPLISLLKIQADIYPPEACPLCRQGLPAVKPGSRALG